MANDPMLAANEAAASIAGRHLARGGQDADYLPDDALGLARHVLTHRALPGDRLDALRVVRYLRLALPRIELSLLAAAHEEGCTWSQIAGALGVKTPQAAYQRHLRLLSGKYGGVRDEKPARANLRARQGEAAWMAASRHRIRDVAQQVAAPRPAAWPWWSEDAEDAAAELADLLHDPDSTPGYLLTWLAVIVREWRRSGTSQTGLAGPLQMAGRLVDEWTAIRPLEP